MELTPIYTCYLGSRAYGTDVSTSDWDFRSVGIAPLSAYLGIDTPPTSSRSGSLIADEVIFELRHFATMAAKGNPTACEMLFADGHTLSPYALPFTTRVGLPGGLAEAFRPIYDNRRLFLTKDLARSLFGYAYSMLKQPKRPKDVMQGARVTYMLRDLLEKQELVVRRPPDQISTLLSLRQTDVSKEVLEGYLNLLRTEGDKIEDSPLPDSVSRLTVNELVRDALCIHFGMRLS